ncbi:MAG: ABC transporter ATP-binding protein [Lachnospiraceae bacterium]|nr:ABC transporter ATP-binding protein [Lachnospiraceae bacterium]
MKKLGIFKNVIEKLNYILNREQKIRWFLVLVCIIVGSFVELLSLSCILPLLQSMVLPETLAGNAYIGAICDFFGISPDNNLFGLTCLAAILIYFIKNTYLYFSAYITNKFNRECQRDLSTSMLEAYMSQPYEFFLENNTASMLRGINEDVAGAYEIVRNLFSFVSSAITASLIIIYLINTDISMTLGIIIVAVFCVLCLSMGFKTKLREYGRARSDANKKCNQTSMQALSGIKEIMVFNRNRFFVDEFGEAANNRKNAYLSQSLISSLPPKLVETICIIVMIGLVYLNYKMNVDMTMLIPKLGVFAMGALKMMPLVSGISSIFADMVFYYPSLENVYKNFKTTELKRLEESIKIPKEELLEEVSEIKNSNFCITAQNVCWKYPRTEEYVLYNLNMVINKGEAIALIGVSGAGKSTLADVLLGLLPLQEGNILINNRNIKTIPLLWPELVSYVPQSVYLIDDSIRNNVAFGIKKNEIDDSRIWAVLEKAQLKDFVQNLPKKLDTIVGERGVKFSGGQRQRIAIARALYSSPEILVLDEATSALDNETELAVMESINALHGEITLIVIAHRLSTIRECDRVYEIKDGKAVSRNKDEVLASEYNNKTD